MNKGLIHIYTGDGKGKTSAAVGLSVRAAGHGFRVLFCQFLKGQPSGEISGLQKLGVEVRRPHQSEKFYFAMNEDEQAVCKKIQWETFTEAQAVTGDFDLIVLDEIFACLSLGIITREELIEMIDRCKGKTELVLTGRTDDDELYQYADYVTEMKVIKHPYEQGISAREGIEY